MTMLISPAHSSTISTPLHQNNCFHTQLLHRNVDLSVLLQALSHKYASTYRWGGAIRAHVLVTNIYTLALQSKFDHFDFKKPDLHIIFSL